MRGMIAFYSEDAYCLQTLLSARNTDIIKSISYALIGFLSKSADLVKVSRARRDMAEALIRRCLDDKELVGGFVNAREAEISLEHFNAFP